MELLGNACQGQSVDVWMDRKGSVQTFTGADKLMDSIAALAGDDKREVKYFLQNHIGGKVIADELNEIFAVAPDHIEKTGETWVRNVTHTDKTPVKLSSMYVVKRNKK